jgi:hypothetical protein
VKRNRIEETLHRASFSTLVLSAPKYSASNLPISGNSAGQLMFVEWVSSAICL